jgi:two-component system, cell cycle sensor histidine kinase and response regulator CckA
LATCRTIVQQFGGHIDVSSEIGKGTIFKIYLPRVEPPIDIAEPIRPAAANAEALRVVKSTDRILVVDDEASVRQLTTSCHPFQLAWIPKQRFTMRL